MRLLIVTPYHAPAYAFGGPVRIAETMVTDLLAAGHEVTVVTTDVLDERRRLDADPPQLPPGARVVRFRNVSHQLAVHTRGWTPRGYRAWIREHARDFDLVHLHDVYSVLCVTAARAAHAAGVPYVMQPFGSLAPTAERGKPLVKRAFLRLWGGRLLDEAAALIHSTEQERQDFLAVGAPEERLVRMPLPLELPEFDPAPLAEVPTLVYVGRLDPIKRIDLLLRATALARATVSGLRLDVVGPGDAHRRRLEALSIDLDLRDAVTFHGFVSTEEKLRLLGRAHASCLLSRSEGLPVAALEAMACGTPVVLSQGCHLPEVQDRAGVVVGDEPEEVAGAITALVRDRDRRDRLGAGAQAFAAEFSRERVMPQMTELFERVALDAPDGSPDPRDRTAAELARITSEYEERDAARDVRAPEADAAWLGRLHDLEWNLVTALREAGVALRGARALDVGCCDGLLAHRLLEYGAASVSGIELTPWRVEAARRRYPELDVHCGSASEMPFAAATFDLVTQLTCLSSILDPLVRERVAAEMWRVLAPGGVIVSYDLRPSPRPIAWLGARRRARAAPDTPVEPLGVDELRRLFPDGTLRTRTVTPNAALPAAMLGPRMSRHAIATLPPLRSHLLAVIGKPS